MSEPELPDREAARLAALYKYEILDTSPEAMFDHLVCLTAHICDTPIALINFIDRNRQWFKANIGWTTQQIPRNIGFCPQTILQPELLIVPDAYQDIRFADNPLVTSEPHIRFYAGVSLITSEGQAIGTLCVMDRHSRVLDRKQAEALSMLGRQVVSQLESRRQLVYSAHVIAEYQGTEAAIRASEERFRQLVENLHQIFWISSVDMKQILYISPAYEDIIQRTCASLYQQPESWLDAIHPEDRDRVLAAVEKQLRASDSYDVEYRIVQRDGTVRWLWARLFPVRNEQGTLYRFAGIAEDITERKQTEQQIQASLKEKDVRDNRVGFPRHIDFRNPELLGLQLVNTLAEQIKGTVELNCDNITEFSIEFILPVH